MPLPAARLKEDVVGHLDHYASQQWPQVEEITIRWHGSYGYLTAWLPDDEEITLCRLRYTGSDTHWEFALYTASTETYQDSLLPDGNHEGTPEQALDCSLGLYLAHPAAWLNPPKN